jgi:hypothetical protein
MKAESEISPTAIRVERHDGIAEVILAENIALTSKEGRACYQYDEYRISIADRSNLERVIESGFSEWMVYAKAEESKPVPLTVPQKVDLHDSEIDGIVTALEGII